MQMHLYQLPFYMMGYNIAEVGALQFWQRMITHDATAWPDYVRLCQAGGSRSFLELLQLANLKSPFAEGTLSQVIQTVEEWLAGVDESGF